MAQGSYADAAISASTVDSHCAIIIRPALVAGVEAIGMTVSDVDRSVEFFQQILSFEKVSDIEVLVLT